MYRIGLDGVPLVKLEGGIGYSLFHLLDELIPQHPEWKFFIYILKAEGGITHFKKYSNVVLRRISFYPFSHALWTQTSLAYAVYKDDIDLFWGSTQLLPLLRKKKLKTVLHIYDFVFKLYPHTLSPVKRTLQKLLTPRMIRTANCLLTISHGTSEKLFSLYNKRSDLIIHPAHKTSIQQQPREKVEQQLDLLGLELEYKKYFLSVSTLEPRKNFLSLVDTYLHLLKKNKDLYPLAIIGGGGWKNRAILQKLHAAKTLFPDQIKLLGRLDDQILSHLLSGARYYLCFSLYEGYGMPLAEARMCHTPVICFDQPELREATENDAFFLPSRGYEQQLEKLLTADYLHKPSSCHYPSNKDKAISLARAFLKLLMYS